MYQEILSRIVITYKIIFNVLCKTLKIVIFKFLSFKKLQNNLNTIAKLYIKFLFSITIGTTLQGCKWGISISLLFMNGNYIAYNLTESKY